MLIATYRKACTCRAGAHPGRIRLDNVRVTTIRMPGRDVPYDVPMADLVLDPAPSCDQCLREWEEVNAE